MNTVLNKVGSLVKSASKKICSFNDSSQISKSDGKEGFNRNIEIRFDLGGEEKNWLFMIEYGLESAERFFLEMNY